MKNNKQIIDKLDINEKIQEMIPKANIATAKVLVSFALAIFVLWICLNTGFFEAEMNLSNPILLGSFLLLLASAGICHHFRGRGSWMKYMLFIVGCTCLFAVNILIGYRLRVGGMLPMLISLRYYDKKFTNTMFGATILISLLTCFANAYLFDYTKLLDLGTVRFYETHVVTFTDFIYEPIIAEGPDHIQVLISSIKVNFIPNLILLILGRIAAAVVMDYNLKLLVQVQESAIKSERDKLELDSLKSKVVLSQIKPHFLYNTLSSIAYLCTHNPNKAKEMTLNFSDYLRGNMLVLEDTELINFSKEMFYVDKYLEIEKERFANKLTIVKNIKAEDFMIPPLSVQTIVENAIKHGICEKEEGGTVEITALEDESNYAVYVKDDGIGFDTTKEPNDGKVHVGISNTRKRLEMLCKGTMYITSEPGKGTMVSIIIPKEEGK